jgi:hypothetical protein
MLLCYNEADSLKTLGTVELFFFPHAFLGAFAKGDNQLRHICPSVCLSAWNNSAPNLRIFMKFDIFGFLENVYRKFKFY